MSWIRMTVQAVHLLVLLLVCGMGFYNLNVRSQQPAPVPGEQEEKTQALTVVQTDEDDHNDSVVIVDSDEEIIIENPEPFIPTNEWQKIKPGQAIPRGLHVRLNMQTGEREARLLQEDSATPQDKPQMTDDQEKTQDITGQYTLDELKKAVKTMKNEKFKSVDMETLQKEHQFRSYEELKQDLEDMNLDIKTDAEVITELVEKFSIMSHTRDDVTAILEQLEYYLHQIDNAMLFCDLGAMPMLLRCLNNSMEKVRSEAALTLGSALQSNPKVQVSAVESGAMHEVLRLLVMDTSMVVRKRAMYALSAMIRAFPFAQKRFLEMGGLSVLGKMFEDKSAENLQVRAVTLLADLIKEKTKHREHADLEDSTQKERLRQYQQVPLQEAMVQSGWCVLIPSLLNVAEHDSREKVLVAMDTVLPVCRLDFQEAVPALRTLQKEYTDLRTQELSQAEEDDDDGFFLGMVLTVKGLLTKLSAKDEL